jgi:hypothetical protein
MSLVTVPQTNPNDELTAVLINQGPNALAAVVNGQIDDTNVSSISGSKVADGTVGTTKIVDGAITPAKRAGGYYVGEIATSVFSTTGAKTITGVGFTPRMIKVTVGFDVAAAGAYRFCNGFADGTRSYVRGAAVDTTTNARWYVNGTFINVRTEANVSDLTATFTAFTSDGFTINVSAANSSYSATFEAYA